MSKFKTTFFIILSIVLLILGVTIKFLFLLNIWSIPERVSRGESIFDDFSAKYTFSTKNITEFSLFSVIVLLTLCIVAYFLKRKRNK